MTPKRVYGQCVAVTKEGLCPREASVKIHMLCDAHNQQRRAGKKFTVPRVVSPGRRCGFPGCDREYFSTGYCSAHYQQWYKGGPIYPVGSSVRELTSLQRNESGEKKCPGCETWKPETDFSARNATKGDGLSSHCKQCSYASGIWRTYRVTPERLQGMLESQGGCAICHTPSPRGDRRWHIDHDHSCCPGKTSCGKCVRGVLCGTCNSGLGMFRDSLEILRSAQHYLSNWRKTSE